MTLRWYCGFDYLPDGVPTALLSSLGISAPGLSGTAGVLTPGRYGGKCFNLQPSGTSSTTTFGLPGEFAVGYYGFGVYKATWAAPLQVCPADLTTAAPQFKVSLENYGVIRVYDGSNNLLAASPPGAYLASTWFQLAISWTIAASGSGGATQVLVNGTPVLTLTGVQTQATANAWANGVEFVSNDWYNVADLIDDLYFDDSQFLGTVRVQFMSPSGAGASTQFTPSNGALANWQCAGNTAINDTLYVYCPTTGDEDAYAVSPVVDEPVVYGARPIIAARQDDATQRAVEPALISAGTKVYSSAAPLSETYTILPSGISLVDPATSVAFGTAGLNAAQVDVKVST